MGDKGVGDVAIVDLLPGGFDPGQCIAARATRRSTVATTASRAAVEALDPSGHATWKPTYTDVREDRVVIYGTATPDVQEFVYRIKASPVGQVHRAAGLWRVDV